MKKSNRILNTFATLFLMVTFVISPLNAVFADEEPKKEVAKVADADAKDGDADKKKDEPECE